ncbi:protein of unknown function [Daejeonella lutea]|uniref:DUF4249 domain-containing protein n=2 Tax=Daejeonella lutea TaxID=572036 RepID=A0A1T5B3W5_9SPHI|nr:protein of unknown function [Daejeonella lutea]
MTNCHSLFRIGRSLEQGKTMRKLFTIGIFALLTVVGCKKPFNPEAINGFSSALIVEGVINPSGVTNIYLSRTLDLDDKVVIKPEPKAVVQVLSENNTAVTLAEKTGGLYSIPALSLNSTQKYRLRIRTSAGVEYMSDALAVKNTPPIDKFYWERSPEGVGIYVDAQDSQNNTKYYQWDFEEDWEIRSIDSAKYSGVPGPMGGIAVVARDSKESALMFTCYKSQRSTNIDIFSTAKLSADVVSRHRVAFIPNISDKLSVRYSILVRQYALNFEAFEYLSMMKRNTEQLGSFFDAQPSELVGNIRNVSDKNDVAIGYIVIAPVLEKRLFITISDVPGWGFRLNCNTFPVKNDRDSLAVHFGPGAAYTPQYPVQNSAGGITHWTATPASCLDCRLRSGTNVKPAFW